MKKHLTRREFLKLSGVISLGLSLSYCKFDNDAGVEDAGGVDSPTEEIAKTVTPAPTKEIEPTASPTVATNKTITPISYPIIIHYDFEDQAYTESIWDQPRDFSFSEGSTGQAISMSSTGRSIVITTPLEIEKIQGATLILQSNIRAENVTQPANPWNGIKLMLEIKLSDGTSRWAAANVGIGTFGWTKKSVLIDIPPTATSVILYLGLEECSGNVWFDDVIIKLAKDPANFPAPRDPNLPINKLHPYPALRGAMVNIDFSETDSQVLGTDWNANIIRYQIGDVTLEDGLKLPNYDNVLESALTKLDNVIKFCQQVGLLVIIDLHALSFGNFDSIEAQNKFLNVWRMIANRYKNEPAVWAYDLANEPDVQNGDWSIDGLLIWDDLVETVVREIRLIDPETPIMVESPYADPETFQHLRPLDFSIPNIVYSVHMYRPHAFALQTTSSYYSQSYTYPGIVEGVYWDKSQLVKTLAPVKEFQDKYRVPILVGEFSAVRWAPSKSAYNYLKDCLEIFEEYDWDWCYHSFREWDGWSVEHSEDQNDPNPTSSPTPRQQLLRSYFEQNEK